MNATKRKFNTLLQGLGSPRPKTPGEKTNTPGNNDSPSSSRPGVNKSTIDAELLQKRRRMGLPDATAPDFRTTRPIPATSAGRVVKSTAYVPPARYAPSDRNDLLKRLATFQEITDWTPKPDRVNEVQWAKRGWVCQGKETVRCLLCHKELVVKLNRKVVDGKEVPVLVASEIEQALVDKYVDLIVTSHGEDCLWRKRGCDDSLLRLSLASSSAALEALRQRYDELRSRKSFLPYNFNLRLPDDLDLDEIMAQLPEDFFSNPPPKDIEVEDKPDPVALALALLGWQGLSNPRIGPVPNSASCHTCLRRLGLWMFKSKEVAENGEVLVPAPMDHLDPLREHRFFCPWASAEAQKRSTSRIDSEPVLPGWKILVRTLANEAHLRAVYEGRPRTKTHLAATGSAPATPQKTPQKLTKHPMTPRTPAQSIAVTDGVASSPAIVVEPDEVIEDEKDRDAKDKERWARLKKVKSLFDSKGSKRLMQSISRPGTGHSNASTATTNKQ